LSDITSIIVACVQHWNAEYSQSHYVLDGFRFPSRCQHRT